MARFPGLKRTVRIDRGVAGVGRAIDDELRFHFDMTVAQLVANGMGTEDARREAERRFGDVAATREHLTTIDRASAGASRRTMWVASLMQDLQYAARGVQRSPGFALAVAVTLGLGIGANATMFGVVDRLLFRPPAYLRTPSRATRLYFRATVRGTPRTSSYVGYQRYLDLRSETQSFDALTPFATRMLAVGSGDGAREVRIAESGADLWKMFAVAPVIGRFFTDSANALPDGDRVVVLSYAFWQLRYGGRNDVLGARIDIGPGRYTIIGVAPDGFTAFEDAPVAGFIPLVAATAAERAATPTTDHTAPWYQSYNWSWFELFARRKPGVSPASADADLTRAYRLSYAAELASNTAGPSTRTIDPSASAGPLLVDRGPNEGRDAKVATWLFAVAAIVLIVACANVANLLVARALRRRREIAVRIALGVSRGRLLRQLLTESVLLAALGGLLGVLISACIGGAVRHMLLPGDRAATPTVDIRVLIVAGLLTLLSAIGTGIAPFFQVRRGDVASALKAGARDGVHGRSGLRAGLLVAQTALSVVLLVGAGLFVRSLMNVQAVHLGYDPARLLWIDLESRGVQLDSARQVELRNALVARAEAVPSVEHAARALAVPFWDSWQYPLFIDGLAAVSRRGEFNLQAAGQDFFSTAGTRIIRGRGFTATDRRGAALVTVIGESMAATLWPARDAIGQCVRIGADSMPCTRVVGIAEDVRSSSLATPALQYYVPIAQFEPRPGGIFVRTRGLASAQAEEVRRALQSAMPGVSYVTVTPMTNVLGSQTRSWRVGAVMFALFGGVALLLAAIGLYSVIAYNVTQRRQEMGVRLALGAVRSDVVRLVVGDGVRAIVPGVIVGGLLALLAGRWMAPLLFGVGPHDPGVLVGVIMVMLAVSVVASWIPSIRAARVDPSQALRSD